MRWTLGRLASSAGLARSSLLHYEQIGLLQPAGRSPAGYRLYGEAELERLRVIRQFRAAGLSLAAIADLLTPERRADHDQTTAPAQLLEARLLTISEEIAQLRLQQQALARILAAPEFRAGHPCRGKGAWVELLRRAGFSDADMQQWHIDFERHSPAGHATFLGSLGLTDDEIAAIRRWSGTDRRDPQRSRA
ncbi:MAG: hypothetical protein RLY71_571 [Pseudomonadota bacterium]|jgi:DNA-binding transcriptional MerR regulator